MIFKKDLIDTILNGKKKMTSRSKPLYRAGDITNLMANRDYSKISGKYNKITAVDEKTANSPMRIQGRKASKTWKSLGSIGRRTLAVGSLTVSSGLDNQQGFHRNRTSQVFCCDFPQFMNSVNCVKNDVIAPIFFYVTLPTFDAIFIAFCCPTVKSLNNHRVKFRSVSLTCIS